MANFSISDSPGACRKLFERAAEINGIGIHVLRGAQQPSWRMTRLTNAFAHATALHFFYYNLVRVHQTLKVSPAMAAGITSRLWEIGDMVNVLVAFENRRTAA
jgi:hypothetical protein